MKYKLDEINPRYVHVVRAASASGRIVLYGKDLALLRQMQKEVSRAKCAIIEDNPDGEDAYNARHVHTRIDKIEGALILEDDRYFACGKFARSLLASRAKRERQALAKQRKTL